MKMAISIIAVPGIFFLVLACGAPPPSATPLAPADTVVAPTVMAVTAVAASIPPGQSATETPTDTPMPPASETPAPAPELTATAVPTATTPPSPTPPVRPTATLAPTPDPTADPSMVRAEIVDFILPDITIPAGATVIWTNLDVEGHTTTSGKDGVSARFDDIAWDSRGLDPGESFSVTFAQPGVFPYTCKFHPWMNATVTVDPSSSGETSGTGGVSSGGGDGY